MALQRRPLLRAVAGAGAGLAGCSGLQGSGEADGQTPTDAPSETATPDPSRYTVQTPVNVVGVNERNATYTVTVVLEIRPDSADEFEEVRNRTYEFHPDGSVSIGEFEEAGAYRFTVDVDGERYEETVGVPMEDLADCNYPRIEIHLHDPEVSIGYTRTDAACPPATVTPTSDGA